MTNTSSLRFLYIFGSLAYCAAWQPLLPSSKRWLASPELSETAAFSVSLKDYCRQSLLVYYSMHWVLGLCKLYYWAMKYYNKAIVKQLELSRIIRITFTAATATLQLKNLDTTVIFFQNPK